MTPATALPFRIGARTLGHVRRRLVRRSISLAEARRDAPIILPSLPESADGYYLRAVPRAWQDQLSGQARLKCVVRQAYPRHFADLAGDHDSYLGKMPAKARASLRRKLRRFAIAAGGTIDIACYHRPEEAATFCRHARAVSALSYQERLLGAGLPPGTEQDMIELAARDAVRAWLLFLNGRPVSYLYAPATGDTLLYAYLGYDPAVAALSPGTVLQAEAMRILMAERRFASFDFTEGDGQHKRQFATGSIDSLDLLLLRPTLVNRTMATLLCGFDALVAAAKPLVTSLAGAGVARRLRR